MVCLRLHRIKSIFRLPKENSNHGSSQHKNHNPKQDTGLSNKPCIGLTGQTIKTIASVNHGMIPQINLIIHVMMIDTDSDEIDSKT